MERDRVNELLEMTKERLDQAAADFESGTWNRSDYLCALVAKDLALA